MKVEFLESYNPRQKYYDLGFTIKRPNNLDSNLKDDWEWDDDTDQVSKICVSDAHTHQERLVFPAWYIKNKNTGEVRLTHDILQIAGEWTMMIYGGDASTFREPEEYASEIFENYDVMEARR